MTAGAIWAAVAVLTAAEAAIFGMCVSAIKEACHANLREEKQRIRRAAAREIEERASLRAREILAATRIQIGVQLINESDIAWEKDIRKTSRKEDAA